MIFKENAVPLNETEKRNSQQWIQLGVDYMMAKRKTPPLGLQQFATEKGLNYNTLRGRMSANKVEIKEKFNKSTPKKTKSQWIALGVEYLESKLTPKQFAEKYGLNADSFRRVLSTYKKDIQTAKLAKDALEGKRRLNSQQKHAVMLQDFRAQIKSRASIGPPKNEKKTTEWFQQTIKNQSRGHKVSKPKQGRLYTFVYDAKHKATLPHWDVFPLIVYLGPTVKNNLLLGLNLHYVPPKARQEFLEELLKFASNDRLSNNTYLEINWSKVKNIDRKMVEHMVKSYLPSHVKGQFVEIKPADWVNVVYLPTAKFVSGPNNKSFNPKKVWSGI